MLSSPSQVPAIVRRKAQRRAEIALALGLFLLAFCGAWQCPPCYPPDCAGVGCPPACTGLGFAYAGLLEVQMNGEWHACPEMSAWPAGTMFRASSALWQPFDTACDACGGHTTITMPDGLMHDTPEYGRYGFEDPPQIRSKEYLSRFEDAVDWQGRPTWVFTTTLWPTYALYFVCGPYGIASVSMGLLVDVCPGDANRDGTVDAVDILAVVDGWGVDCIGCEADVTHDGRVNVDDLLSVIQHWGACA